MYMCSRTHLHLLQDTSTCVMGYTYTCYKMHVHVLRDKFTRVIGYTHTYSAVELGLHANEAFPDSKGLRAHLITFDFYKHRSHKGNTQQLGDGISWCVIPTSQQMILFTGLS